MVDAEYHTAADAILNVGYEYINFKFPNRMLDGPSGVVVIAGDCRSQGQQFDSVLGLVEASELPFLVSEQRELARLLSVVRILSFFSVVIQSGAGSP
jgi:hypothetical protein